MRDVKSFLYEAVRIRRLKKSRRSYTPQTASLALPMWPGVRRTLNATTERIGRCPGSVGEVEKMRSRSKHSTSCYPLRCCTAARALAAAGVTLSIRTWSRKEAAPIRRLTVMSVMEDALPYSAHRSAFQWIGGPMCLSPQVAGFGRLAQLMGPRNLHSRFCTQPGERSSAVLAFSVSAYLRTAQGT